MISKIQRVFLLDEAYTGRLYVCGTFAHTWVMPELETAIKTMILSFRVAMRLGSGLMPARGYSGIQKRFIRIFISVALGNSAKRLLN